MHYAFSSLRITFLKGPKFFNAFPSFHCEQPTFFDYYSNSEGIAFIDRKNRRRSYIS